MVITASFINGGFALLAALVPFIVSWLADLKNKPERKRVIILGISILAAAAAVGTATSFIVRNVIRPSPQATITVPAGSPAAPARIGPGSDIGGRASDLPHDQLFLVLRSTSGAGLQYYPQAQVSDWTGANWTTALEAPPGAGRYDLMAIDATAAEARGELLMYLQICKATANCPGIDTMPEGVETLTSVAVNVTTP